MFLINSYFLFKPSTRPKHLAILFNTIFYIFILSFTITCSILSYQPYLGCDHWQAKLASAKIPPAAPFTAPKCMYKHVQHSTDYRSSNLPATAPAIVVKVAQKPPLSTTIAMSAPIKGGAALPEPGGWKLIPQYCGTVHSFTVNGCAGVKGLAKLLCAVSFFFFFFFFGFKERLTWAVSHWIGARWCVPDVFAFGYGLDGSAESLDQAVVDPCWITPAWVDCQGFIVDTAAVTCIDQLTRDIDGTGVALSLGAAGSSKMIYYLVDGNRAELDCFVRDWSLC